MCEVAVCKGDVGGHAGACSRVSRCEWNGKVCESRDTREFERVRERRRLSETVGEKPRAKTEKDERRRRLRQLRDKGRVAAVAVMGTVPGLHGGERAVRAVQRTRPPPARLRE